MTNKMMIVVLVISAAVFSSWPVQAADEPNDRVCKEEGRVLTERELIDRYLFTDKVDRLTYAEKSEEMSHREGGIVYPECCYIGQSLGDFNRSWVVMDKGHDPVSYISPHYEISLFYPRPASMKLKQSYYHSINLINECGQTLYEITGSYETGKEISRVEYLEKIESIKEYWTLQNNRIVNVE